MTNEEKILLVAAVATRINQLLKYRENKEMPKSVKQELTKEIQAYRKIMKKLR